MIKGFKSKEAEKIFRGEVSKKLPREIQDRALIKLRQLDVSMTLEDLINPPSNHLERLKGDRAGQYSIRINNQFRVCFLFEGGNATDVEIVDYH